MGEKVGEKNGGAGAVALVFKVDLHCEGCAQKVKKNLKHLPGVDSVKADHKNNTVTVVGKVDPAIVKQRVEEKTNKTVDFLSPQPANNDKAGDGAGAGEKKVADDSKKHEHKNPKEVKTTQPAPATTAVLKTNVHCDGCANKMRKIIGKCQGVQTVNVELSKDQIVIKGTMDMKEMLPYLNVKLKRPVELLPPPAKMPKEDAKPAAGGGGGEGGTASELPADQENFGKIENVNKMEYYGYPYGYGGTHIYNPQQVPEYGYVTEYGHAPPYFHAPQMFSDENPNACSIM